MRLFRQIIYGCIVLSALPHLAKAQCVDAGPDQIVCAPGGQVTLQGSVTGTLVSAAWTPSVGISNPNSLTPTVTVTGTTTFTLNAQTQVSNQNLIPNGDFSAGASGFTSAYINSPSTIFNNGVYAVATSPNLIYSNFPPCGDHTSGNGNMMLVNGDGTINANVWCVNVVVTPNTSYTLGAWVSTLVPFNTAQLQFNINGLAVGNVFGGPPLPCNWIQTIQTWNSGASTTAQVCINNMNSNGLGNDFILDDISMTGICSGTDQMTVTVIDPLVFVSAAPPLPCNGNPVTLSGTGSSTGSQYSYQWTANSGNIVSGATTLNPSINQPGNYILQVTYNNGTLTCNSPTALVNVGPPINNVSVVIANPAALGCTNNTVTLNASASSQGTGFTYSWTALTGNIVAGANTLTPTVDQAGQYELTITDANGCQRTGAVVVTQNTLLPVIQINPAPILGCSPNTAQITSSASGGTSFTYQWIGNPGTISQGAQTPNPIVSSAGTYVVTVTNTNTGCTATASTQVTQNTSAPTAVAQGAGIITCDNRILTLNGNSSISPAGSFFNWTTPNGGFISATNQSSVQVGQAGMYILEVVHPLTGCSDLDTILVTEDLQSPTANAGPDGFIGCNNTTVTFSGTVTNGAFYAWTANNGQALQNSTSLQPIANQSGTYFLTATNLMNGCKTVDTVQVISNTTPPQSIIANPGSISCTQSQITLDGSGSSAGSNIQYLWTSPNGNFIGNTTNSTAQVNASGVYWLTVLNIQNGCRDSTSVQVQASTDVPIAIIATADTIRCGTSMISLDATNSYLPTGTTVNWIGTGLSGNLSGLSPNAMQAGTYVLELAIAGQGCDSRDTVVVIEDLTIPTFQLSVADTLTCSHDSVGIQVANGATTWQYHWSGNAVYQHQNQWKTSQAGWIYLETTHPNSLCQYRDSVLVYQNLATATSPITGNTAIACNDPSTTLSVNPLSGTSIIWSTATGTILSSMNSQVISAQGLYFVEFTHPNSGCITRDSITVTNNSSPAIATAAANGMITCGQGQVTLQVVNPQTSVQSYAWTTSNGSITMPTSTNALAVSAGQYTLTATHLQSGCTATDLVTVLEDISLPQVNAGQDDIWLCQQTSLPLSGNINTNGHPAQIEWSTNNGAFQSMNTSSANVTISSPGAYYLSVLDLSNQCFKIDTVNIVADNNAPIVNIALPDSITCSNAMVQLNANGSSSGSSFISQWSSLSNPNLAMNTLQVDVTNAGVYQLTITNPQNQCTNSRTITVYENKVLPSIQFTGNSVLNCTQTSTNISAIATTQQNGQWNVVWSSSLPSWLPPNGLSASMQDAGNYSLQVTDLVNGCSATNTIQIQLDTLRPTIQSLTATPITCDVTSSQVNAIFTPNAMMQGIWTSTNGQIASNTQQPNIEALIAGTYTYTLTNGVNGCSRQSTIAVQDIRQTVNATATVLDTLNCVQNEVALFGTGDIGTDYSIQWTSPTGNIVSGATTLQPMVNQSGWYYMSILHGPSACVGRDSVFVEIDQSAPIATIMLPNVLSCKDSIVVLSGQGSSLGNNYTYQWTSTQGVSIQNPTQVITQTSVGGNYQLLVTQVSNGCTSLATVVVESNFETAAFNLSADGSLSCLQDSVQLLAVSTIPNTNFQWWTPSGISIGLGQSIQAMEPGIWSVESQHPVTGCFAQNVITVNQLLPPAFDLVIETPTCINDFGRIELIEAQGIGALEVALNGAITTENTWVNLMAGTYEIELMDSIGCTSSQTVILEAATPLVVVLDSIEILDLGSSVVLTPILNTSTSAITSIEWTPSLGLSCSDCLRPTASPLVTSIYQLYLEDENGCRDSAEVIIFMDDNASVYFPSAISPNGDGNNDTFYPFAKANTVESIIEFRIFNRWGDEVFRATNIPVNDETEGWNGAFKGDQMNSAVFVWYAKIRLVNGREVTYQGEVTVVR